MNVLVSPSGVRHEISNVRAFARENQLDPGNLHHVINGERQHHKGWRSDEKPMGFTSKPYAIERYLSA